ncbi:hypothetical protein ABIE87_006502 [Bradyrhizobium diazoefficiens]|jgi:hypothetical protein|uniref:hypothetical protein n=1 Tax=Bradyrhizobium diazoefficiens TaxID=1355477 RepID=UPI003517061E
MAGATPMKAPLPWTITQNSWQYTTVYDANKTPVCQLDLEDWGVTEGDQDELEAIQAEVATRIISAVNNHMPMMKSLEHCAKLFDTLAQTMDRWATQSQTGGWSTHQVEENIKRANDCRRYAAEIRSAVTSNQSKCK